MFDSLSDRLNDVFKKFSGKGTLDEATIQAGLREVRLALLEADVNFKVVKQFTDRVGEQCLGQDVLKSLTPGQQVIKIVHDELVELLGGQSVELELRGSPAVIMMVGLQGSGKTTSTAKIALKLRKRKFKPYLVPADVYRPAAIDQLHTLAKQIDMPAFASTTDMNPVDIARQAIEEAKKAECNVVILDTAGRLHIDEELMQELKDIKAVADPTEILFVADAMTGQDAVTVAESFDNDLNVTGVVLTKMDGDARGGAALSIKTVTGKPIKYVGMGEKLSEMEVFHPDRIAGRILGMGDMLTLIEKAQSSMEQEEADAMAKKMAKAEFDLEDFRTQMKRLKKLGSMESLLKMIPGMGALQKKIGDMGVPEDEMKRVDAMISSMTMEERRNPDILNGSRKKRIATGSGSTVQELNQLLQNFSGMRKMMKQMMGGGKGKKKKRFGLPGMGGGMPGMGGGLPGMGMPGMGGMPGMEGMEGMEGMDGMPGMGGAKSGSSSNKSDKKRPKRLKPKKDKRKKRKKK